MSVYCKQSDLHSEIYRILCWFINPRRACAERVTVVVSCVCVCVCACVRACVCARVCVCACVRVRARAVCGKKTPVAV